MKPNTTNALMISMLALCAVTANVLANPNSQNSEYIDNISLSTEDGINSNLVVLKNTSASKSVGAIKITTQSSSLAIDLIGNVKCLKDKDVDYKEARAYFGPVSLFVDSIVSTQALYDAPYAPSNTTWNGTFGGKWITESGNSEPFTVPLASIKQGHPAVRFDPVEELNKKLQAHLNQGGNKLSFYQQDQFIEVQRPVSMAGWCKSAISFSQTATKAGYETTTVKLTVKYEGDPDLINAPILNAKPAGPVLNAQLAGNLPNQINQDFPFMLNTATFQPNMPHHVGQCIPDKNPKIRINYAASGNEQGIIDLIVAPVSNTYAADGFYFQTAGIVNNPKNGASHIDFNFPLKEMLSQNKYAYMTNINQTFSHNMQIKARYKPFQGGNWSEFKDFGTATFKHRCTPKLNVNTPNGLGGYQNGGAAKPMQVKPIQPAPAPKPMGWAAPKPAPTPKPMAIKPAEPEPKPTLILKSTETTPKPQRAAP